MNEAVQILGERLAKGEITPEEFKARLAVLTEGAKTLSSAPVGSPTTDANEPRANIADEHLAKVWRYFDKSRPITLARTAIIAAAFGAAIEAAVILLYAIIKIVLVDRQDIIDGYDYYTLGIFLFVIVVPTLSLTLATLLMRRPCENANKLVRFGVAFMAAFVASFAAFLSVAGALAPILNVLH